MKKIVPGGPETMSDDLVAANIDRLKESFPEAFTEGKIDFAVLRQLLGGAIDDREEKYGMNWHGKRRARQIALTPSLGTLRPCPEESVDWETTQNLMIEGDNLEVLKLLQKSYAGKVKLIYIDPPYNTGKDFIYNDNFYDTIKNYLEITGQTSGEGTRISTNSESSGRFHTNWLNMVYPRLRLARNLLRPDGTIFVSIDDAELDNLRKVMDELFGQENFIATLVWERGRKNDARRFSVGHEYIVGYAKDLSLVEELTPAWREPKEGVSQIVDEYHRLKTMYGDDYGAISSGLVAFYQQLPAGHPSKAYSRSRFVDRRGIWRDNNITWPGGGGPKYTVIHPATKEPCKIPEDGWRFIEQTMEAKIRDSYVEFREDHTKTPFLKSYLYVEPREQASEEDSPGEKLQVMGSVFYRHSQPASDISKELFGEKLFENPKDHTILARLIRYCTSECDIVLDFFAGSGSAAHAVLELNIRDGGERHFILVQLPEPTRTIKADGSWNETLAWTNGYKTIADLTRGRVRRVREILLKEKPLFRGDLGFRVFKLDSTNIQPWDPDRDNLSQTLLNSVEHVKADRTEDDILFELLLKLGLELTVPIEQKTIAGKTVHCVGVGTLFVCLAPQIGRKEIEPVADGIAAWRKELAPAGETTIVFLDSAFADDVAKTNITAILKQHGLENVRSL